MADEGPRGGIFKLKRIWVNSVRKRASRLLRQKRLDKRCCFAGGKAGWQWQTKGPAVGSSSLSEYGLTACESGHPDCFARSGSIRGAASPGAKQVGNGRRSATRWYH